MSRDHEASEILTGLFDTDFLAQPFIRQAMACPWFYLEAQIREGKNFVGEMLMISSFESLKSILSLRHESFRVQSIKFVTPSFVNQTGDWKMEPLLEAIEATDQNGELISLFRVSGQTYSNLGDTPETNLQNVKVLFPLQHEV
ncbi:hypothetical protein [Pseudomonas fluorescens]|uniref:hypothetical protein n=1 Tax=Pseudomonas fluorescens TaxID=294 RepID=UPI0007D0AC91|nr:hypothetical protein [Pseudomonas fluorescens]